MNPGTAPETRPHGSWPSPLSAADLASAALRLGSPTVCEDGSIFWLEGRPAEGGRTVVVRHQPGGAITDVTPAPFYVRSRVHEYGGGAYAVQLSADGPHIFFVNFADQAIYRQPPAGSPIRLTPDQGGWRFADLVVDPARPRLLAVGERHRSGSEPENVLVAVDTATGAVEVLVAGADFYASPTPSPDGSQLAWLSWNHPHMPWDAAALHLADLDRAGRPQRVRLVAGDAGASAQQPAFGPDGALWFLFEGQGFHNLWRDTPAGPEPVIQMEAEMGLPLWQLGVCTWGFLDPSTVLVSAIQSGTARLQRHDLAGAGLHPLAPEITAVHHLSVRGGRAALFAGFPDRPAAIVELHPGSGQITSLRAAFSSSLDPGFISLPEPISFATSAGDTAFGFHYPPRNPDVRPPPGEKPPLIVMVHGGPTAASVPAFNAAVQFWTTRGFAVLDVNYRGSTGYGRPYRDRLNGQWGVYDVDDCRAGARALCEAGRADPARVAIRGGSAGGYTVLAALVGSDLFAAGASHYGVSDLAALVRDTHKFESRYCDALIGSFEKHPELYRERSPLGQADRLRCPVIFFQGLDDKVVPPDQTERLVEALRHRGLSAEYHAFAGEQHGFRRADTIQKVLEAELAFYGKVLGSGVARPAPLDGADSRQ
jgi:dipeptidyl aminopeptidase/acylaminoacyl peptidase